MTEMLERRCGGEICRWARALQLQERLAFVVANATLSMKSMLDSYPGDIVLVSIQVPDTVLSGIAAGHVQRCCSA